VAFAAAYPGKVVAVDLAKIGGELICQKDASLCAALGTSVSVAFSKRLGAGFFGGEGAFLAELSGTGTVYIQSLPFSRMANRILAHALAIGGKEKGEN
jgi:uncharacterized protein (AIM24 family)